MTDDLDREDRILGTALSRAVESQHVRETPFERSRLAARLSAPGRSFPLGALALAAAFVLLVGGGAYLLGRGTPAGPGATEPPVAATTAPAATAPTATPVPTTPLRIWFARDQLPPFAAEVAFPLSPSAGAEERIRARFAALSTATAPAGSGSSNALASSRTKPALREVRIEADLVRLDWDVPNGDWGVGGTAGQEGLLQQLVYTATEEAGMRRAVFTENGGRPTTVFTGHGLPDDTPLTREDVSVYSFKGTAVTSIANDGSTTAQEISAWSVSNGSATNGVTGILGRVSIDVRAGGPPCETSAPCHGRLDPAFKANTSVVGAPGECAICAEAKWRIVLTLPATSLPGGLPGQPTTSTLDSVGGPIRGVSGQLAAPNAVIGIYLDDQRPWRVTVEPTGDGTARINVDVGGRPSLVNQNVAVYGPQPAETVGRTFTVSGAARVFEANVAWRLREGGAGSGRELATGHTLASIGTSPVWGTFRFDVTVPANVVGSVTLEVFWASPKDGAEMDLIRIPLLLR